MTDTCEDHFSIFAVVSISIAALFVGVILTALPLCIFG